MEETPVTKKMESEQESGERKEITLPKDDAWRLTALRMQLERDQAQLAGLQVQAGALQGMMEQGREIISRSAQELETAVRDICALAGIPPEEFHKYDLDPKRGMLVLHFDAQRALAHSATSR